MKLKVFLAIAIGLLSAGIVQADTIYTKTDSLMYESIISKVSATSGVKSGKQITDIARQLIGKPYVSSTLDKGNTENLVVNLQEFDCTTFVETCIAIYLASKSGNRSFGSFCSNLAKIRYRNGSINGYASRLHYATEWIYENEKKNIFYGKSLDLRGSIISKPINYMTSHAGKYKQLASNRMALDSIRIIEQKIRTQNSYRVIPVDKIKAVENQIQDGDIILFATNIAGLDYSHMGIAYRSNGELTFIHSSSKAKKIVIQPGTLADYCAQSKVCSGISVQRLY